MLHSTREYQMSRNMNTRRSLYIICLLLLSAVGNKLDAQTVVKSVRQANDSTNHALIHQIGFDVRPGYVAPTNSFLEGDNAQRQKIDRSLSLHLKYAFQFSKDSYLGRLYPHAYQGIGVSHNTFYNSAELEIQWRYTLFKGRLLYDFHPVCRWIMSGISVLLSVGNNMMNIAIGTMTLSVLKSMRISIWALS